MSDLIKIEQAVTALREEVKSSAPNLDLIKKANAVLDGYEAKNQELVGKIAQEKSAREELEAKYASLEADMKRGNFHGEEKEAAKAEMKAFDSFLRGGEKALQSGELKYLRTDSNTEGGYLVTDAFEADIAKNITEISNLRQVATVRSVGAKTTKLPTRTGLLTAGWVGEGVSDSKSNSTYGQDLLSLKKIQVTVDCTHEELQDSSFNIASLIQDDVVEEFARIEGAGFVNGASSPTQPEGFMTNASISSINSGSAAALTFDSLVSITGQIKTGYNPMYGFNRLTRAVIRTMKDGDGAYLWQAGNVAAGIPNSLNGYSYIELPDMPDISANTYPVIFGDFKNYIIGDGKGMIVIRDDYSAKRNGKVEFTFFKRVTGLVRKAEAFKKIKIAA